MADQLILLTGDIEAPHLTMVIRDLAPDITVTHAASADALEAICDGAAGSEGGVFRRRLIAYCTSIIASPAVLQAMDGPSYNFHPGPPAYPGVHSASFAIFDQATEFGVTAHVMDETPDAGDIVGTRWFDLAADSNCHELESRSYLALFDLFRRLAPRLVDLSTSLETEDTAWGPRRYTKANFTELATITDAMDSEEIARRHRAIEF